MNIGAIGGSTPNYTPQIGGGQDKTAQLERKLEALNKQLREVKQDGKLPPDEKKKAVEELEKKIAEIEKRIQQLKQESKNDEEKQVEKEKNGLAGAGDGLQDALIRPLAHCDRKV